MLRSARHVSSANTNNNVRITADHFNANDATYHLLRHPPKFIPTPQKCCHRKLLEGVFDFLRKYKWRHAFFTHARRDNCRFVSKSSRHPPDELIPTHVLSNCRIILNAVYSVISSCRSCFPEDNLTPDERQELTRLSTDDSIVVTPVDKGSSWIIVPASDYRAEARRQLSDNTFYESVNNDNNIDKCTAQRLNNLLNYIYKKHFLSRRELLALKPPSNPRNRFFYLLPKVHKADWHFPAMPPGRPIVSDCGSVSRACAALIEYFLAPLAKLSNSYVRDSMHVISLLTNISLNEHSVFVTMDIRSLYTNIPATEGIAAVSRAFLKYPNDRRPDLTILTMLRILLSRNVFRFDGQSYLQVHGTAMGCPFGASYANIFLAEWDSRVLEFEFSPCIWLRFIDDVLCIWNHDIEHLHAFHRFVNSLYATIKVDLNFHIDCIRFLDLELYRVGSRIYHRIGFKPTDTHYVLTPDSYHRPHVFKALVFGEIYRWTTHSSTYSDFKATKQRVQRVWRRLGYSRSVIRDSVRRVLRLTQQTPTDWEVGFFPCASDCTVCDTAFQAKFIVNTVNDSYAIVHRLTCNSFNVIYLIECKKCKIRYVGQTARPLRFRIAQHLYNIHNTYHTSVTYHFTESCSINDFTFTALEHCPDPRKRLIKESMWIKRLNTLSPAGLNLETNRDNVLRVVLPQSDCSERVFRVCQRQLNDVTISPSYTTHPNLRSLMRGDLYS